MLTWGRVVISLSAALRMEPRALCVGGQCPATELYSKPRDKLLAISSWSELV